MVEFDWVTARQECSIGIVFQKLKTHVKDDVGKRQALREGQHIRFEFGSDSPDSFSVFREQGNTPVTFVKFSMKASQITVTDDDDKVLLTASLTLDNKGQCKLKVKGDDLEEWQFRKMALEALFFSGPTMTPDPFAQFGGKKASR